MRSRKPKETLQQLNLLDRFLFAEAVENQEFLETVLDIILGDDIALKYPPQAEKEVRGGLRKKKVRFDVWDEDMYGIVYDVEVQDRNTKNLPRRSRYYQGLMDSKLLPEGTANYNALSDLYIILIAPFDLFGKGMYQYTFTMTCAEDLSVHLEDGAVRMFLNTRGRNGDGVSEELIAMLRYFEVTTDEVAEASGFERIHTLHEIVDSIRRNEEIGVKYMNAWEEKILDRQEAFEEDEAQGKAKGEAKKALEIASNLLKAGMDKVEVAKMAGLSIDEIEALYSNGS